MMKTRINLLQPELLPVKQRLTLTTVVALWGVLLLTMLGLTGMSALENKELTYQYQAISQLNTTHKNTLNEMEKMLVNRKVDTTLESELDKLKYVYKYKNLLKAKLTNTETTEAVGYAKVMTELAQFHHQDISLTQVKIIQDNITLSGITVHAEAVPNWLTNFEQASFLSGKTFADFSLSTEQDNYTSFSVSSIKMPEQTQ